MTSFQDVIPTFTIRMILKYYAYINLVFWWGLTVYLLINTRRIRFISSQKILSDRFCPSLSVIVTVRNEERALAAALETLCNLDYPNYELIVVNDRSTDTTHEILESFRYGFKNLHIVTITELPANWLGKNHAMFTGYTQAKNDWLLF